MNTFFFSRKYLLLLLCASLLVVSPAKGQSVSSGIPSDGRDFFIGFVMPSFMIDPPAAAGKDVGNFFNPAVLICSYYDNTLITISYFDKNGTEVTAASRTIAAKQTFMLSLDTNFMRMAEPGDKAEYKACHITSTKPVSVTYFSTGATSGGSYLALPTAALGKKYVLATYNDNPRYGAATNSGTVGELAGGGGLIVAAFDNTQVNIIPNGKTKGGHIGVNTGPGSTGSQHPYTITLERGQCYLVKGDGSDEGNDLTGSVIESNKPVALLGFHEDAFIGDIGNRILEARDFMIEQMMPSESWDNKGYVNIPLKDTNPQDEAEAGYGENYRAYTNGDNGAKVDLINANGVYNMFAVRFSSPTPEKDNVGIRVDFVSEDQHKFGVMLYDNRGFGSKGPYPAPSMMTVVPMSRWKTHYIFNVPANTFQVLQNYFLSVIALKNDFDKHYIKYSYNDGLLAPLSNLSSQGSYIGLPNHPELKGVKYSLSPGTYYLTNIRDAFKFADSTDDNSLRVDTTILRGAFMVYHYGMRAIDPTLTLGDFNADDNFFSYANPVGMSLSSGDSAKFKVTVDTFCAKWHICVHDGGKINAGIRSISLLDDSSAVAYPIAKRSLNCHLDPKIDRVNLGDVELPGDDTVVCFDVFVTYPLDSAYAAVLVTTNAGNKQLIELRYSPLKFSLTPASHPITFGNMKIGTDSCMFISLKNTSPAPQIIQNGVLASGKRFSLASVSPVLPVTLAVGDSVMMKICFSATDTAFVSDTLNLSIACLTVPIQLTGRGASGLIFAGDLNLGKVTIGISDSRALLVNNIGTKPFTLTNNWTITGSNAFSFTTSPVLPTEIQPQGQPVAVQVKYLPTTVGKDTAIIHWNTDIDAPYTQSVKSYSVLTGEGITSGLSVKESLQESEFSVRPNPANGNSIFISSTSTEEKDFDVQIFDVLGRELFKRNITRQNSVEILIRNLQNGIYYAKITCGTKIVSEKFEVVR